MVWKTITPVARLVTIFFKYVLYLIQKKHRLSPQKYIDIYKIDSVLKLAKTYVINKRINFKDSYDETRKFILSGKVYNYLKLLQNV